MDFGSETPLRSVESELGEMKLGCRAERAAGTLTVTTEMIYRAYDGRLGLQCTGADGEELLIPLERISNWSFVDPEDDLQEYGVPHEGDLEALQELIKDDIKSLMRESWETENGPCTWERLVREEELSRLAPSWETRNWHYNQEQVIYLTMAASTTGETHDDLATRVGGAMWAVRRVPNADRVAAARTLVGLKAPDDRFIEAAESLAPHEVARVCSSAMFVGLGGEAGTAETLRLLTLLQIHAPVPRFF